MPKMRFELTRRNRHYPLKVACLPIPPPGQKKLTGSTVNLKGRAKNGTRTRDPNLGKVVLYQLSYFRIFFKCSISHQYHSFPCQGWKTFFIYCGKVVLYQLSYFRIFFKCSISHQYHSFPCQGWKTFFIYCGKVVLYQLSYFRIFNCNHI